MTFHSFAAVALVALAATPAQAPRLEVYPGESRQTSTGPPTNFVGSAMIDVLFTPTSDRPMSGAQATFSPGSRSAWHSHPAGQVLIVTSGTGWVQEWQGEKRQIRAGDVVWTPPGVKHWHGGTATSSMTHIAIQQQKDGKVVEWMEPVTDAQYRQ